MGYRPLTENDGFFGKVEEMKKMNPNINNMKQAVFELFGVGSGAEIDIVPAQMELLVDELVPAVNEDIVAVVESPTVTVPKRVSRVAMSYIAAGTVFEGNMRSDGDVEMAGEFIGDIDAKGVVKLFSSVEGNVNAGNLTLTGCTLKGNATVSDTLVIGKEGEIHGYISAKEVHCAGQIHGDMTVVSNATLEHTAKIHGSIIAGSFAVAKGAVICGGIEIKGKGKK